jgi:hypothetical protein
MGFNFYLFAAVFLSILAHYLVAEGADKEPRLEVLQYEVGML